MVPLITTQVARAIVDGLILSILFGAIATWIWVSLRLITGRSLFPEKPIVERRDPPWGLGTIVLIVAAYLFGGHYALEAYVRATRGGRPDKVAEAPARAEPGKEPGKPGGAVAETKTEGTSPREPVPVAVRAPDAQPAAPTQDADSLPHGLSPLELMAIQGAINGVFLLILPGIARLTSGARLRDLGLCLREWRRQAAVGVVAVLFLMPIIYTVQALCISILRLQDEEREKFKHPLEKMLRDNFSPGVAALAFVTAVLLAPVFEELLFRGFIQSWLVKAFDRLGGRRRPSPADRSPATPSPDETSVARPPALNLPADPGTDASRAVDDPVMEYWEAAAESGEPPRQDETAIELARSDDALPRPHPSSRAGAAIVTTSIIFAALHAAQWPAPIPLFLLAVGLGFVYQRTGSLLAPICMHAVFNGFSTLMLFHVALEGTPPEKTEVRPVLERVAPVEKVKAVAPNVGPGPQPGKT